MNDLHVFPDAETPADLLPLLRALLVEAFSGCFSAEDWEHTQGGWRAVALNGEAPLAHAAVVPRLVHVAERPLQVGYVEGVAARPGRHREGLGSQVMTEIGAILHREFEMGVLSTGRHGFYRRLGWDRWHGPSFVRDDTGLVRTADEDDGLMVLRFGSSETIDLAAPITCERRSGDDW